MPQAQMREVLTRIARLIELPKERASRVPRLGDERVGATEEDGLTRARSRPGTATANPRFDAY